MDSFIHILLIIVAVWVVLFVYFDIPARMARARQRPPWPWMLVSLVGSPFLAIALLLALGDAPGSTGERNGPNP